MSILIRRNWDFFSDIINYILLKIFLIIYSHQKLTLAVKLSHFTDYSATSYKYKIKLSKLKKIFLTALSES